jgi:hypothetical protein
MREQRYMAMLVGSFNLGLLNASLMWISFYPVTLKDITCPFLYFLSIFDLFVLSFAPAP